MKKLALLALLALVPAVANAAPGNPYTSQSAQQRDGVFMGLGGSLRSDDASIYLPIEISPMLRVEPFFQWSETDLPSGVSAESRQLGAGGFFRFDLHDHLQTYAGGRLSFVDVESGGADLDGFALEPTVGVEFWATSRFSLALEAYLYWRDLDGSDGAGNAVESESTGSNTRILLRFFP